MPRGSVAVPRSSPVLQAFLAALRPGPPLELEDAVIVPLLLHREGLADADLLEEGIAAGITEVCEVDAAGDVNSVRVVHHGGRPLLVLDGEEILGAKQNRVFNASFLVGAGTAVTVPVSCVERGRWHARSDRFTAAGRTMSSQVRRESLARVARSVSTGGLYDADQGAVWRSVDAVLARSRVRSVTRAYSDVVSEHKHEIGARVEHLAPISDQVGYAEVRGDRLVLLDLLGSPYLFSRAWRTLARGIASHIGEPSRSPRASEVVREALVAAGAAGVSRGPAPGIGETLHGMADGLAIGAVALEDRVVHCVIARPW